MSQIFVGFMQAIETHAHTALWWSSNDLRTIGGSERLYIESCQGIDRMPEHYIWSKWL